MMKITLEIETTSFENLNEAGMFIYNLIKTHHKSAQDAPEEPKVKKTTPSIPKEEKAAEEPKKTPAKKAPKEVKVTLADLKELAKQKVISVGREKVKAIIAEFADKLAEVKESDYVELAEKLAV